MTTTLFSLARRRRCPEKFQYATAPHFRIKSGYFGTCSAASEASPQQQQLTPATLRLLECIMVRFPWVFIRHCAPSPLAITITISISALANTVRDNSITFANARSPRQNRPPEFSKVSQLQIRAHLGPGTPRYISALTSLVTSSKSSTCNPAELIPFSQAKPRSKNTRCHKTICMQAIR